MKPKIVLINPPVPDKKIWVREGRCQQEDIWGAPFPPLSLALISTQLVKIGFETRIIDSGPEHKNIQQVLEDCLKYKPDIAILATTTPTIDTDLGWFAVNFKQGLPFAKVVAIGIHVSALPIEVLKRFDSVDFVVIGEPELTCKELVLCIYQNELSIPQIRGIAYKNSNRDAKITPAREFIDDIDTLGFPDWKKIDFNNYKLPISARPFSLIVFSRGCPYNCNFCATQAYNGYRVRKRTIASIIDEIKYNLSFGIREFLFWTEQITLDKEQIDSFLNAIFAENLQKEIRWVCNSRVDTGNYELFVKMKKAGCWQIAFGLEFGNDKILKLANKGGNATTQEGRRMTCAAHKAGLIVDGHFIMGYPGETSETLQDTIDYACSLPLTFAHFYTATPFPGSKLYNEAAERGWIEPEKWSCINQESASLQTSYLNRNAVDSFITKAYRRFYLRPKIWKDILKLSRGIKEHINLIKLVVYFIIYKNRIFFKKTLDNIY